VCEGSSMKDREARERIQHLENLEEINDSFLTNWPKIVVARIGFLEERVAALEDLAVEYPDDDELPAPEPVPALIAGAIDIEKPLLFRYTKPGEEWESRMLSPYELIKVQNGTIVRGWDHDREEIRSFRLDRIEALTWACTAYRKPQNAS
jgi:predicted DNA-binding transcriptional regulator YafY